MVKTIHLFFLLIGLLTGVASPHFVAAQESGAVYEEQWLETKSFDDRSWENLQKELDYSGQPRKAKKKKDTPRERPDRSASDFDFDFPDLSNLFKVILAIIVLSLLAWLIFAFIQQSELKIETPVDGQVPDEEVDLSQVSRLEEELDRRDVDPFLLKAEQSANYHLAVRLHFLALLKQLNDQQLIQWKKDRTNRFYLNQMREQATYADFRELTLTFERVWYGNYHPAQAEYETIKHAFQVYRQQLKPLATT